MPIGEELFSEVKPTLSTKYNSDAKDAITTYMFDRNKKTDRTIASTIRDVENTLESWVEDLAYTVNTFFLGEKTAEKLQPYKKTNPVTSYILQKANGGIVDNGSLFWAGESGAEFVGNIGNTSAVANTQQMTDAIYKAAYMGMSKALKENGGNGMGGYEPATMDDLFIAMRKKASNYNKMTGNPAFN